MTLLCISLILRVIEYLFMCLLAWFHLHCFVCIWEEYVSFTFLVQYSYIYVLACAAVIVYRLEYPLSKMLWTRSVSDFGLWLWLLYCYYWFWDISIQCPRYSFWAPGFGFLKYFRFHIFGLGMFNLFHRLGHLSTTEMYSSQFWRLKSEGRVPTWLCSVEGPLSGCNLFPVSSHVGITVKILSGIPFKKALTDPFDSDFTFMT